MSHGYAKPGSVKKAPFRVTKPKVHYQPPRPPAQISLLQPMLRPSVTPLDFATGSEAKLDGEFKRKLIDTLVEEYRSAGKQLNVLQLGCGDGSDFLEIAARIDKNVKKEKRARLIVSGVDDHLDAIKIAQAKLEPANNARGTRALPPTKGRFVDSSSLDSMFETFDVTIATFSPKVNKIEADLKKLIELMKSHTVTGGYVAIQFPTRKIGFGGIGTGDPYNTRIVNLVLEEARLTPIKFMVGKRAEEGESAFGYAIAKVERSPGKVPESGTQSGHHKASPNNYVAATAHQA